MGYVKKITSIVIGMLFIMPELLSFASDIGSENIYNTLNLNEKYGVSKFLNYDSEELPEEVKAKRKAMENFKVLIPKTDSEYEIALAYSDGSYTYVDSCDSIEEAMSIADNIVTENDVLPAVINGDGNVVYSTNAMGRVLVYRNGSYIAGNKNISLVYSDSDTSKQYTYINQDYMDDVPIIEQGLNASKIQISGYSGWMQTTNGSGNYDLVVIPMNQVKDPSFYYVENGLLYHYISTDMTKNHVSVNDWDPELGQAPSYMKEGIKYFSYDGKCFYTGESDIEGLNKLITDLKNNTNINSINYENEYFNYYNIMPYRTKSEFTAEQLNWVIDDHINRYGLNNSKLIGIGEYLIEAQNTYGVNATLILALAIHESNWGTSQIAQSKNNLFGLNAVDSTPGESANYYKNIRECIMDYAKNYISNGYTNPDNYRYVGGFIGNKNMGSNVKYASDPFWGEKVAQYAFKIDYRINRRDLENLKELSNYSLGITKDIYEIVDDSGEVIYKSNAIGTTLALAEKEIVYLDRIKYYKVNNEVTSSNNDSLGKYQWTKKGYVQADKVQIINSAREKSSKYIFGDMNYDEKIDILDISDLAIKYNTSSTNVGWNSSKDLNKDKIVDIFDIISISKNIK